MYIPKAFREDDSRMLHAFMREYSFATLVTQQNGVPFASHVPFILDAERGPHGTLLAHIARAVFLPMVLQVLQDYASFSSLQNYASL